MLVSELKKQAYRDFNCTPTVSYVRGKRVEKLSRKARTVDSTIDKFITAINSKNPPATEQDLINQVSVTVGFLAWFFFKQLIVAVLKWCWKKYLNQ